jgi:hypothetical protein
MILESAVDRPHFPGSSPGAEVIFFEAAYLRARRAIELAQPRFPE